MTTTHPEMDLRIEQLESIIHRFGIVLSKTALSSHHLVWCETRIGPLGPETEPRALHVARLMEDLPRDIAVLPRMRMPGRPTVFVSRWAFPSASRVIVYHEVEPLKELGTADQRKALLEVPIARLLRAMLPDGYTVAAFPGRFHNKTRDIAVASPDRRMFDIELRNHRSNVHDVLRPEDRKALEINHASGRTTVFVTPRSTLRFQEAIAPLGGVTIDTNTYLVADPDLAVLCTERGWSCWPATTPAAGAPRIAAQVTSMLVGQQVERVDELPGQGGGDRDGEALADAQVEIDRLLAGRQPTVAEERVGRALELHASGVSYQKDAAQIIGCSAPTLSNAFRETGTQSPWRQGGSRPGSGRPRRNQVSQESTPLLRR